MTDMDGLVRVDNPMSLQTLVALVNPNPVLIFGFCMDNQHYLSSPRRYIPLVNHSSLNSGVCTTAANTKMKPDATEAVLDLQQQPNPENSCLENALRLQTQATMNEYIGYRVSR